MKTLLILLATLIIIGSCSQTENNSNERKQVIYPDTFTIFAPGFISTPHKERDLTISPDGRRMLFTKSAQNGTFSAIMETVMKDDKWSEPEIAAFSGNYSDLEPAFSPDGKSLFFASNRPITGDEPKDFDIWKVSFENDTWGVPERLDTVINTKGNEFYPSVAQSGNLYFTASPDFQNRKEDIFLSTKLPEGYAAPVRLSDSVNTGYYEFNAFIDPDEQYIIFSSWGRPDGLGGGDLYLCEKNDQGVWQQAKPLSVNTEVLEYCPFVSPDKQYFFFTRNSNDIKKYYQERITAGAFDKILNSNHNGNGDIWILPFDEIISSD